MPPAITYIVTASDIGQSISFEVTPMATIGTNSGVWVTSVAVIINSAPVANSVRITASAPLIAGTLLTGTYSTVMRTMIVRYQWLRDDMPIIGSTTHIQNQQLSGAGESGSI